MKLLASLKEIEELNQDYVKIKDKEVVLKKINSLIEDGVQNLQVVSDYDMTITKQHEHGKTYVSSFGMIRKCPSIPKVYIENDIKLSAIYRPIEIDPNMPMKEKVLHMNEWWRLSEMLLKGIQLDPKEIEIAAQLVDPPLRVGTKDLLEDLHDRNVPVLIMSAGLGNSVEAVLKQKNVLFPNVKVVSNYLEFNSDNIILGYKGKFITVLNKNELCLIGTPNYDFVKNHHNAILMGDHIGDASMVDGVPDMKTVLKIGFLFDHIEESLPSYEENFDIVLLDDQTMDIPRAIFQLLKA